MRAAQVSLWKAGSKLVLGGQIKGPFGRLAGWGRRFRAEVGTVPREGSGGKGSRAAQSPYSFLEETSSFPTPSSDHKLAIKVTNQCLKAPFSHLLEVLGEKLFLFNLVGDHYLGLQSYLWLGFFLCYFFFSSKYWLEVVGREGSWDLEGDGRNQSLGFPLSPGSRGSPETKRGSWSQFESVQPYYLPSHHQPYLSFGVLEYFPFPQRAILASECGHHVHVLVLKTMSSDQHPLSPPGHGLEMNT